QLRVPCRIGPGPRDACQPGDLLIDALQLLPELLQLTRSHWRRGDRRRGGRVRLRRGSRSGLGGGASRGLPDFGGLVLDPLSIGRDAPARPRGDNDSVIVKRSCRAFGFKERLRIGDLRVARPTPVYVLSSATKRTPPRSPARRAGPQPRR